MARSSRNHDLKNGLYESMQACNVVPAVNYSAPQCETLNAGGLPRQF